MTECGCGEYHDAKCPVAKELRNSWCTPKWLAELIGEVCLDPCSNVRSHISAMWKVVHELGGNGLEGDTAGRFKWATDIGIQGQDTFEADADWKVFVNPPYGHGQVIRWVRHYRHTRFIFLLRWDPSTQWFGELLPHCTHVWFPNERIGFEPPPRIKSSSNPFPHALFLRDPSEDLLERLGSAGYVFSVDLATLRTQNVPHDRPSDSGTHREPIGEDREIARGSASDGGGAQRHRGKVGPTWKVPTS